MQEWLVAAASWLKAHELLAPVVQLALATVFAFAFAQQWQRWRQRRGFQYETLVNFSRSTNEMMGLLSELLTTRATMPPDLYAEKRRQFMTQWTVFVSMRGEVIAAYGRRFIQEPDYQGLFSALTTLRGFVHPQHQPVPRASFEPEQEKFLAHREAVVAHMARAMKLMSQRDWCAETTDAHARLKAAFEAARAAAPRAPAEPQDCTREGAQADGRPTPKPFGT